MLAFPIELERLEPVEHRVEAEVHRSHVERGDLGLVGRRRRRGARPRLMYGLPARGDVDHRRSALLDAAEEWREGLGALVGLPRLGVPGMEMQYRRPGLGRRNRLRCDLVGCDRKVGASSTVVWIAPVIAQVMITLSVRAGVLAMANLLSPRSRSAAIPRTAALAARGCQAP